MYLQRIQRRNINVFTEFSNSVRRQIKENKGFQQDVKLLSQKGDEFQSSQSVINAQKALSITGQASQKVIDGISIAVNKTLDTKVVQITGQAIYRTGEVIGAVAAGVTEPIMETEAAKNVAKGIKSIKNDVLNVTGSAHFATYRPKDERDSQRKELLARRKAFPTKNGIPQGPITADNESLGLQLHKSGRIAQIWEKFSQESVLGKTLNAYSQKISESESPILRMFRSIREATKFAESETVKVVRAIKTIDPGFETQDFLNEVAHFTIPELLEAYLSSDIKFLKNWLAEAQLARLQSDFEQQTKAGLISDCKVIDYREVDISKIVFLDDQYPVIVVTFKSTEIIAFKDKLGEIAVGAADNIQNGYYALAFTKQQLIDSEAEYNPVTNGWTIVQWYRQSI